MDKASLVLEDGTVFRGQSFGFPQSVAGEVVFNTGMVGYPEALTDPSYRGQILVLTYPLIGNYGVPAPRQSHTLEDNFESSQIQVSGLVVSDQSEEHNHWDSSQSLAAWLSGERVPAMSGIDTRAVTKRLREKGTLLGKLLVNGQEVEFRDTNSENLVSQVSLPDPVVYLRGKRRVVVVDCGCKNSIIHNLLDRDVTVIRVPWNYNFLNEKFDALLVSNGPGNPEICQETVHYVRKAMERTMPILGICLGHQILALAAGARTYKLKYGHRSQNQPCVEAGTDRCYITSQNHGYAVDIETLHEDWQPWFTNANDGSNEGMRHRSRPFFSIQFHPEAAPGPTDTNSHFDTFLKLI